MGSEAEDETLVPEVEKGSTKLEVETEEAKLSTLLTGEYSGSNAILTFHAGTDGTEAQDWAWMLFRIYARWAERHDYAYKTLDYLDGDEIGLKSATVSVEGGNAYGHLRSEHGVHRLVRVSPFDTSTRRQTSFVALEVVPEIPDDVKVDIRSENIEVQVFRSSGAGNQHINKTSSAVHLIHKPAGIAVSCRTERNRLQNRGIYVRTLRPRLVELRMRAHAEKISDIKDVQLRIEWGSQVRSYVLMPYQLIKNSRTGYETSNISAIMDGELDGFISVCLRAETIDNRAKK